MYLDLKTVEENRRRFINDLRTNPYGIEQIFTSNLIEENKRACALGLALWTFNIDPSYDPDSNVGPYDKIMEYLGLTDDENYSGKESNTLEYIWRLNDLNMMSFSEIGDVLENGWFE